MDYLLDSNVIIDFIGNRLPGSALNVIDNILGSSAFNSVITRIEVLGYNGNDSEMNKVAEMFNGIIEIGLTENVVQQTIELRKIHRRIKLPDLIIAATALEYNLELITHNLNDFQNINKLVIIDSYKL